jgi:Rod binding domain-containing protein
MNIAALSSPSSPAASSTRLSNLEHAHASQLKGAALRSASPAEQRTAVAAQFEAILVRQLLGKTMSKMMGSGDSTAGSVYGDMITDTLAQSLTAGQGLGIGRMIEQQLTPRGVHAAATDPSVVASTKAPS